MHIDWSACQTKCLLLLAGLAEHDVVAAVSRRFTSQEITAALAFLQQQGLVNASGVKRPLMLSRLFAEHMEVTFCLILPLQYDLRLHMELTCCICLVYCLIPDYHQH